MSQSPKVSVIIPTYNRRQQLERALKSVRKQSFEDYEIIVVDDGSTDGTRERIEKHVNSALQYIRHDENRGAAEARNKGIDAARGKYLAFLDSDDTWTETKLEQQVPRMEGGAEDVGLIYTGVTIKGNSRKEPPALYPSKRGNIFHDQLYRNWIHPTSTWMVRKGCFEEVGNFHTGLEACQDYEMNIRICEKFRVDFIRQPLTIMYHDGNDRISSSLKERLEARERVIREVVGPRIRRMAGGKPANVFGEQYFTMARRCQRFGDFQKARKYFKESLSWNPLNPKAWVTLLLSLMGMDLPLLYYRMMYNQKGRNQE